MEDVHRTCLWSWPRSSVHQFSAGNISHTVIPSDAGKFSLAVCPGRRGNELGDQLAVSVTEGEVKDTGDGVGLRDRGDGKRFPVKMSCVLCEAERVRGLLATEAKPK